MDLELAKSLYAFEWELRDKLTSWLQTPITTLTVLGAAISYLLQTYVPGTDQRAAFFYATIAVASAMSRMSTTEMPALPSGAG